MSFGGRILFWRQSICIVFLSLSILVLISCKPQTTNNPKVSEHSSSSVVDQTHALKNIGKLTKAMLVRKLTSADLDLLTEQVNDKEPIVAKLSFSVLTDANSVGAVSNSTFKSYASAWISKSSQQNRNVQFTLLSKHYNIQYNPESKPTNDIDNLLSVSQNISISESQIRLLDDYANSKFQEERAAVSKYFLLCDRKDEESRDLLARLIEKLVKNTVGTEKTFNSLLKDATHKRPSIAK